MVDNDADQIDADPGRGQRVARLIGIAALLILVGLAGWIWQDQRDLHATEQPKVGAVYLRSGGHDA